MSLLPDGQYQNLEQQHILAKDLLAAARGGDPEALARIRAHRTDAEPKLADAQLALAREAGFPSWSRFTAFVEVEQKRAALGPLFPRFTEDLRRVLFFSRYQAAELGSPLIEPEHVLLALLQNNAAAEGSIERLNLLTRLSLDDVRPQVSTAAEARPAIPPSQQVPFSDATKAVFVAADREAVGSGAARVMCGHVLVGCCTSVRRARRRSWPGTASRSTTSGARSVRIHQTHQERRHEAHTSGTVAGPPRPSTSPGTP
jgi:hypothetical protein